MSDQKDDKDQNAIIEELRNSVARLEEKNRELVAEKRRQGEGKVDAAELERVEAERDKLAADLATVRGELKTVTKTAETATKALEAEKAHTAKLLVSDGLTKALAEAGVTDPKLQRAAAALLRAEHGIEVVTEGDARIAKVGDKSLPDFVKTWAQGDDGKTFVAAPVNGGGGATGGSGGGGKSWTDMTMTEQGQLYNKDPAQAKALASQAGVELP